MVFVVDIGNSNIVVSSCKAGEWKHTFRYETKGVTQETYYEIALRQILMEWGVTQKDIRYCVFSSVVPDLNQAILEAIFLVMGCPVILLGPDIYKKLDINVPQPYEIGTDLVANAYGAIKMYGEKVIVADFGTALSFVAANTEQGIVGVTIAPGLKTAAFALGENTAQLPVVPLQYPLSYLGKDTLTAIQAGIMYGYTGLFKQLIQGMQQELGHDYKVILTGGHSSLVKEIHSLVHVVNPYVTLEGMRMIGDFIMSSDTSLAINTYGKKLL